MNNQKRFFITLLAVLVSGSYQAGAQNVSPKNEKPQFWLTDPDQGILFKLQKSASVEPADRQNNLPEIKIDPAKKYQTMDGFGFALTGGSAMLISKMSPEKQTALLHELFGTGKNDIGASYLRVSIGASDLDDHVFSYDDLPAGETDADLKKFSLAEDQKALIPVLKKILTINPHIKILGSPWSPPVWMKTNDSTEGGHLKPEYYRVYTHYFIKYIKEMAANGIRIDAVTLQNEPLNPNNNPSMVMTAEEQDNFIKNDLGPGFKAAGIKTKVILYDHNADRPDYPLTILNDPKASVYVDGSAFHLYGGKIEALAEVHNAHPDKNLYFTEEWVGAPGNLKKDMHFHIKDIIIGATRNWCKNVIEWNLAADPQQQPHTPGGCTECLGAVTLNSDQVTRNSAYYIVAHAAKFVRPGSKRIESNYLDDLPNVAFLTPAGQIVVIVYNNATATKKFVIKLGNRLVQGTLNAGATGTYVN